MLLSWRSAGIQLTLTIRAARETIYPVLLKILQFKHLRLSQLMDGCIILLSTKRISVDRRFAVAGKVH